MTPDDPRDQPPGDPFGPSDASAPSGPGERTAGPAPAASMSADELASALLDGEITGPEAAAARQRPEVAARVAQLAAVRSALRRAPLRPADPAARERAIAAALAEYEVAATPPAARRDADVVAGLGQATPLGRRHPAPRRARTTPRWLGAVAAAAVVAAGIAGLAVLGSSSSDDAETADLGAAAEEDTAEDAGSGAAEAPASGDGSAEEGAEGGFESGADAAGPVDLGEFASVDELAGAIPSFLAADGAGDEDGGEAATAPSATTDDGTSDQVETRQHLCPSPPGPVAAGEATVVLQGRATVAGTAVDVWLVDGPSGRRLVVVDSGCAVVADQALD